MSPEDIAAEEKGLRIRLQIRPTIYIADHTRQQVALAMHGRGELRATWGRGADEGLLICERAAAGSVRPYPLVPSRGGRRA